MSDKENTEKPSPDDLKQVEKLQQAYAKLKAEISKVIVGQDDVIDQLFMALFCRGHCLLVGVPGLAKTLMISTLAQALNLSFNRIQFTPDLMPSDITGTEVIQDDKATGTRSFKFLPGPVFANVILADEINRTPPKTQAALLESMQERHVTVGGERHDLDDPFFVLATQNPIEQEGTYNLPEAQLDRFLMHVRVDYPSREEELAILELDSNRQLAAPEPPAEVFSQQQLFKVREDAARLYLDPKLNNYIVDLVQASRKPEAYDEGLKRWCRFGASPRATIALARCARARAWLDGEEFVAPHHIQAVAPDVLRHRILLTFEGEAEGISCDEYIRRLMEVVAIP